RLPDSQRQWAWAPECRLLSSWRKWPRRCRADSCRGACRASRRPCQHCRQICLAYPAWAERFPDCRAVCRPVLARRSNPVLHLERTEHVPRYQSRPSRHQKAAGLSRRCRGQSCATRWPLHRAAGLFQSAAAERKDRAAQARSRKGPGMDGERRAAVRSRHALPRRRGHHQAAEAQQSGKGDPAQGTQGQGRRSSEGGRCRTGCRRRRQCGGTEDWEACRGRAGGKLTLRCTIRLAMPSDLSRDKVCVARIGAAHGVRGEVKLWSFTEDPAAVADYGPLETQDGSQRFEIEALRPAKDHFVARIVGIADRDAEEKWRNVDLYIRRAGLQKIDEAITFYHADLIGLKAVTQNGDDVGTVSAIHTFGASDVIEIKPPAGESLLMPFTDAT